jgi:hypothetical protein
MKKINIISVHHQWAYKELSLSIRDACISYGFDAQCYNDINEQTDFNIFITGRNIGPNPNSINIVFETDHAFLSPANRTLDYKKYTRSLHFFDYGKDLRRENIYHCPIGYSKYFDTLIPRIDKRSNFHMGRTTPEGFGSCRQQFRDKFNLFTVNLPGTAEVINDIRDELIVTSKVNINSKFHENYAFVAMHAALILCKGKMLLQEDYGLDDYSIYKPYLILFTEKDFQEKLNYWADYNSERKDFEAFIYEDIKKHKFEDIFYSVIGDLLEQYK